MALTGEQSRQLRLALTAAFPSRIRLRRMLSEQLDVELEDIAGGGGLADVLFEVIRAAQAEGWVERLAVAALRDNPGNPQLVDFHRRHGLAVSAPSTSALETLIRPANPLFDVEPWLARLAELSRRVCRVEVPGKRFGTGFLVGPRLVLTNHHVVAPVLDGARDPAAVRFRFGYRVLPDGREVDQGVTCRLAGSGPDEWLALASPAAPHELGWQSGPAAGALPREDELDVAVVRVDGPDGEDRGFVPLDPHAPLPEPGDLLVLLQHPDAQPIRVAIESDAVVEVNANGTRVRHRANTLPGSSGSPCFDGEWNLVAVHHSGEGEPGRGNVAVPAAAVAALLAGRGVPVGGP